MLKFGTNSLFFLLSRLSFTRPTTSSSTRATALRQQHRQHQSTQRHHQALRPSCVFSILLTPPPAPRSRPSCVTRLPQPVPGLHTTAAERGKSGRNQDATKQNRQTRSDCWQMIYYYLYYFIVFIFGFSIFTYFIISLVDSVLMISLWTLFFSVFTTIFLFFILIWYWP